MSRDLSSRWLKVALGVGRPDPAMVRGCASPGDSHITVAAFRHHKTDTASVALTHGPLVLLASHQRASNELRRRWQQALTDLRDVITERASVIVRVQTTNVTDTANVEVTCIGIERVRVSDACTIGQERTYPSCTKVQR